jgi:hypothetical protein
MKPFQNRLESVWVTNGDSTVTESVIPKTLHKTSTNDKGNLLKVHCPEAKKKT